MTKKYYECHITMEAASLLNKIYLRRYVQELKWKFSAIDGDPSLGKGVKYYATRHFNSKHSEAYILRQLKSAATILKSLDGVKVIREKIELVIHDTRSSTVRCDGACVECHTDDHTQRAKDDGVYYDDTH